MLAIEHCCLFGSQLLSEVDIRAERRKDGNFDATEPWYLTRGLWIFRRFGKSYPGQLALNFRGVSTTRSSGDKNYSPLVRVLNGGGVTYNAPIVRLE